MSAGLPKVAPGSLPRAGLGAPTRAKKDALVHTALEKEKGANGERQSGSVSGLPGHADAASPLSGGTCSGDAEEAHEEEGHEEEGPITRRRPRVSAAAAAPGAGGAGSGMGIDKSALDAITADAIKRAQKQLNASQGWQGWTATGAIQYTSPDGTTTLVTHGGGGGGELAAFIGGSATRSGGAKRKHPESEGGLTAGMRLDGGALAKRIADAVSVEVQRDLDLRFATMKDLDAIRVATDKRFDELEDTVNTVAVRGSDAAAVDGAPAGGEGRQRVDRTPKAAKKAITDAAKTPATTPAKTPTKTPVKTPVRSLVRTPARTPASEAAPVPQEQVAKKALGRPRKHPKLQAPQTNGGGDDDDDNDAAPTSSDAENVQFQVGSIVRKNFDGKWFVGKIVEVDEKDLALPYYVRYEDGDQEDMSHEEAVKCVTKREGSQPANKRIAKGRAAAAKAAAAAVATEAEESDWD